MFEVLALQALEQDIAEGDFAAATNSNQSICCAGCNSLASTGGCGGSKTRLFD
jgi:hypothetical protein